MLNVIKEFTKTFEKKQFNREKQRTKKQEHTHVKNLKRQLMTKYFLWRNKGTLLCSLAEPMSYCCTICSVCQL